MLQSQFLNRQALQTRRLKKIHRWISDARVYIFLNSQFYTLKSLNLTVVPTTQHTVLTEIYINYLKTAEHAALKDTASRDAYLLTVLVEAILICFWMEWSEARLLAALVAAPLLIE